MLKFRKYLDVYDTVITHTVISRLSVSRLLPSINTVLCYGAKRGRSTLMLF